MKRIIGISFFAIIASLPFSSRVSNEQVFAETNYVVETEGCKAGSLPKYLDLKPCSEAEIRQYYSSLNQLEDSKKSGVQVLQYLKPILYEMNYFTYTQVGNIYAVTDRDWVNSPNLTSGTYDSVNKTVSNFSTSEEADSNPYINMLYVDYSDGYKTKLKNDKGNANFDKEHVWCQSRGFKAESGAKGPAGTDLHHLIAGDSYVNESIHNNNPYGFVNVESGKGNTEYTSNNKKGNQKHTSTEDQSSVVFEPMDEWKGDIARAIFYMMARYNNISGKETITQFEPNLVISNYATSSGNAEISSATKAVDIGILSDLLAWNKLDPVSEFEIYRNDLIYRNYQGNRNPFIDFPQWIDAIWGTANEDGTGYSPTTIGKLNPSTDVVNGNKNYLHTSIQYVTIEIGKTATVYATSSSDGDISWEVGDTAIVSLDKNITKSTRDVVISALKVGKTTVLASTTIDGQIYKSSIEVNVTTPAKGSDTTRIIIIIAATAGVVIAALVIFSTKKSGKKKSKSRKKRKY